MSACADWTAVEINTLRSMYIGRSASDIARVLARPASQVRWKAAQLGLKKPTAASGIETNRTYSRWDGARSAKLRRMFPNHTNADIAQALGCSVEAVIARSKKLGLRKSSLYKEAHCICGPGGGPMPYRLPHHLRELQVLANRINRTVRNRHEK